MSADEYLKQVVAKYTVDTSEYSNVRRTALALKSCGEAWAGGCLRSVTISGSFAKLTAVSSLLGGGSDIDLFISLTSNCKGTMRELYDGLYAYLVDKKFTATRQNVSVGVKVGNVAIDLVPAKRQRWDRTRTTRSTSAAVTRGRRQTSKPTSQVCFGPDTPAKIQGAEDLEAPPPPRVPFVLS